jgi:UDP-N-acetylglucosamine 2-epimerase (non-hydrolysing)
MTVSNPGKLKVLVVMGARPNFMKVAPLIHFWRNSADLRAKFDLRTVHTGQHYDLSMSGAILETLGISEIDHRFILTGKTHAEQTGQIMVDFEKICFMERPDWVIVVGDVNSTLACAIVTKKVGARLCHVEAGLRSLNRRMPEEINRLATDSITDLFLTTSLDASLQLTKEGVKKSVHMIGNLMVDSLLQHSSKVGEITHFSKGNVSFGHHDFVLLTLHRAENVDNPERLQKILNEMEKVSAQIPIYFPCHPRTKAQMEGLTFWNNVNKKAFVVDTPAEYSEMVKIYKCAKFVMTDSGGIQEETTALGVPCLTLRNETERPITVTEGTNTVIGNNWQLLHLMVRDLLAGKKPTGGIPKFWDGKAAERAWNALSDESDVIAAANDLQSVA